MSSESSARDQFIQAAFWHGSAERAQAILDAHPSIANDIHVAAMLGRDDAVRRFIAEDPSLATAKGGPRHVDALTHLCFSAFLKEHRERSDAFVRAATALLDAGASPNTGFFDESHQPRPEWESALYGAAGVAFHAPLTRLLLERGADPNDEEVPYHSVEGPDNDAFQLLLDSGKLTRDSLNMMLLRKSDWHDYDGVKLVLDHGADVNQMSRFDARYFGDGYYGEAPDSTALHVAAWRMANDTLDVLIRKGADVDARNAKGETPLILAVRACVESYWSARRSPRAVKALLAAGARTDGVPLPSGYIAVDELLTRG